MPVETRDVPRPSTLSRSLMCVSLVLRSIVAVRGILLFVSPFEEALNEFEQTLHLFLRADADADVAGGNVPAIAKNNFVFGHAGDEIRAGGAEIDENEIPGARVGFTAEPV